LDVAGSRYVRAYRDATHKPALLFRTNFRISRNAFQSATTMMFLVKVDSIMVVTVGPERA
jgi:hypothetical protein